ncbi:hypothetical protein CKA32_000259 [Geitlerinema sp. FC II]|nr:hypothetical protein CKA32_000259 [Geitlerinema sp. FC II]
MNSVPLSPTSYIQQQLDRSPSQLSILTIVNCQFSITNHDSTPDLDRNDS